MVDAVRGLWCTWYVVCNIIQFCIIERKLLQFFSVYSLEMKIIIFTGSCMKFLYPKGHYIFITRKELGGKGEERRKWGNVWSDCQESVMPAALIELCRVCTYFTLLKNQAIWLLKAKRLQALSNFAHTNKNDLSKQSWRVRLIASAGLNKISLFDRTICWKMLF